MGASASPGDILSSFLHVHMSAIFILGMSFIGAHIIRYSSRSTHWTALPTNGQILPLMLGLSLCTTSVPVLGFISGFVDFEGFAGITVAAYFGFDRGFLFDEAICFFGSSLGGLFFPSGSSRFTVFTLFRNAVLSAT